MKKSTLVRVGGFVLSDVKLVIDPRTVCIGTFDVGVGFFTDRPPDVGETVRVLAVVAWLVKNWVMPFMVTLFLGTFYTFTIDGNSFT